MLFAAVAASIAAAALTLTPALDRVKEASHQSTVPPASASIFINSCATCCGFRLTPRWGPSLAQNSSMSSSPELSSSAAWSTRACRNADTVQACQHTNCTAWQVRCTDHACRVLLEQLYADIVLEGVIVTDAYLKDLLQQLQLLQVDLIVNLLTGCVCHAAA